MKKNFRLPIVLCLLLLLAVFTAACGKQNQPANQAAGSQPLKLTFAGGQASGTWYLLTNGITECINKTYPGSVITVVPGSGVSNITRVNNKQADLSTSHSVVVVDALSGREPFEERQANVAVLASFYDSSYQIVVDKKLGINSFEEIINNKIKIKLSVDQLNSTAEVSFKRLLNEYGVTYDDFKGWGGEIVFRQKADSSDMLSDGYIDGYGTLNPYPSPTIQEADLSRNLVLLSIDPYVIERLSQKYGYGKGLVPANTYKNSNKDVTTFTSRAVIIMPKDAPEDVAYKVARSLHLNLDYLRSVHAAMKDLNPEYLAGNFGAPLHKGAEKYYKEAGIIK